MKRSLLALSLMVVLVACNAAQIVQIIATGAQIAITASQDAGVLNNPQLVAYFNAGTACLQFASTEISTTDSKAVMGTKITGACAAALSPTLASGTPQKYVNLAASLGASIAKILAMYPPAPAGTAFGASAQPAAPALSAKDTESLTAIKIKLAAAKQALTASK